MQDKLELLLNNIEKVIIGKHEPIKLVLVSLLAKGHLLIEDSPGLGKTILARALALSISSKFRRVQCTPDLLPSDITGVSIYNKKIQEFEFRQGPIFTNILLVDEINRTTPRTQSSMLEAMAEGQVSSDGNTYELHAPFMVIATQNPIEFHGTYPLPEAQLDRFFMRIDIGYPSHEDEVEIMKMQEEVHPIENVEAVINLDDVLYLQKEVTKLKIEDRLFKYISSIVQATREHEYVRYGASPRGSLALMRAAQAFALVEGRTFVDPDIIKKMALPVLAHRIVLKPQYLSTQTAEDVILEILSKIEVPA